MQRGLTRSEAEDLLKALMGLQKAQALYPAGHGAVQRARETAGRLLDTLLQDLASLLIKVVDGYLTLGGVAFLEDNSSTLGLRRGLDARKVREVVIRRGVAAAEVGGLLEWLRSSEPTEWRGMQISVSREQPTDAQWSKAKLLHGNAVDIIKAAGQDVREGRTPDLRHARECLSSVRELLDENPAVLGGLLLIKDYDNYTYFHSVNVGMLSLGIGRQLGLSEEDLEHVSVGGLFHDIGKTRTPVEIIRKPGRLTAEEFTVIQQHPTEGTEIVRQIWDFPEPSLRAVCEHHIRFDGGGYPARAGGSALHPLTPIVTVADVYDAMTTHRPYQKPLPLPVAIERMEKDRGTHFAPAAYDAFLSLLGRVPVGTLLRLQTGEVAVATRLGQAGEVSEVRIVAESNGMHLPEASGQLRIIGADDIAGYAEVLSRGVNLFDSVRPSLGSSEG